MINPTYSYTSIMTNTPQPSEEIPDYYVRETNLPTDSEGKFNLLRLLQSDNPRDSWNAWVKDHPKANITFLGENEELPKTVFHNNGFDFSILDKNEKFDFFHWNFPNGRKDFSCVKFGDGGICFHGTQFGDGDISFKYAQFKNGIINFTEIKSGQGDVLFDGAKFSDGRIFFNDTQLGNGNVSFNNTEFGNGDVYFSGVKFGDGEFCFNGAKFDDGRILFNDAQFGDGSVSFNSTEFGKGGISFRDAIFKKSSINFSNTKLDGGHFDFTPKYTLDCKLISFHSINCQGVLNLAPIEYPCVLNFTQAKLDHPVDLSGVTIKVKEYKEGDTAAFRRLKEMAKQNEDHTSELEFFAQEIRSSYDFSLKDKHLTKLGYRLYDFFSNFGRDVATPFWSLIATTFIFSFLYHQLAFIYSSSLSFKNIPAFLDAFTMSASYSLPFYAAAFSGRTLSAEALFKDAQIPSEVILYGFAQGILSGIFLFLIFLALRNMFRT